jgi:hypothetical protein
MSSGLVLASGHCILAVMWAMHTRIVLLPDACDIKKPVGTLLCDLCQAEGDGDCRKLLWCVEHHNSMLASGHIVEPVLLPSTFK